MLSTLKPSQQEIYRSRSDAQVPKISFALLHLIFFPTVPFDVLAAEDIFGPDLGTLKGKTTRRRPHKVRPTLVPIPPQTLTRYRSVTICVDVMFVNRIAFVVTISRNLQFGTVEAVPNQQVATLVKAIEAVSQIYRRGGFLVEHALMDHQFVPLRGDLADIGVTLNETGRDEHVGEVERYIRTIKERVRCIYNTLPFAVSPPRIIIEMVNASVFWLNAFPHRLRL
jgi:hypothetical protein